MSHNAAFLGIFEVAFEEFFQGFTQYMTSMLYIVEKINDLAYEIYQTHFFTLFFRAVLIKNVGNDRCLKKQCFVLNALERQFDLNFVR